MVYTHRSPMYLPRKQREIGGCGSTAACRRSASAALTRTTSKLNDSRQVHSLPLKHLRPRVLKQPPHQPFIFTLFGAAGCGKQAENIHQFSFASKARLFSLRYITSCGFWGGSFSRGSTVLKINPKLVWTGIIHPGLLGTI